jgi:hypothetical protein
MDEGEKRCHAKGGDLQAKSDHRLSEETLVEREKEREGVEVEVE